jgi:hypothetical protein
VPYNHVLLSGKTVIQHIYGRPLRGARIRRCTTRKMAEFREDSCRPGCMRPSSNDSSTRPSTRPYGVTL